MNLPRPGLPIVTEDIITWLVQEAAVGDARARHLLVEAMLPVVRLWHRYKNGNHDALGEVQFTLVIAVDAFIARVRAGVRKPDEIRGYVRLATKRAQIDEWRRQIRNRCQQEEWLGMSDDEGVTAIYDASAQDDAFRRTVARDELSRLRACAMTKLEAAALEMKLNGVEPTEIGQALGKSKQTIHDALNRVVARANISRANR